MSNFLKLQKEALDLAEINELIVHESCGGVSFFVGTTRDNFECKKVTTLEYEAYDQMALKSLAQICDELRAKWPDIKHIAIHHRLGLVAVKEASVIIGISSPHRETSLLAVQMAIDRLKQIVPIWKKESYAADVDDSGATAARSVFERIRDRSPIDFTKCPVNTDRISRAGKQIATNLVQIHADEAEVRRRLNCFVERKREEINETNVKDFIEPASHNEFSGTDPPDGDETCARVRSSVYRYKNASSHLKVHRVKNEFGPQTQQNYTNALDKLMQPHPVAGDIRQRKEIDPVDAPKRNTIQSGNNAALNERLDELEQTINLKPVSSDVYKRIKAIESRIIYLETVSPEYNKFMIPNMDQPNKRAKKSHSLADIDLYMRTIQRKTTTTI